MTGAAGMVVRARASDTDAAFSETYAREHDRLVRALAVTLGDADLAAEAIDEAFARAYARWRTVGAYAEPSAWLYRVALNWAISRLRRRRFRADASVPEGVAADPEPTDPALWAAVGALPVEQRAVIALRFGLDWPLERIADAVGAPVGTIKSRLSRGVAALRRLEVGR